MASCLHWQLHSSQKTIGDIGWITSNPVPHLHSNQCHSRAKSSLPTHSSVSNYWNSLKVLQFCFRSCTHLSGCVSHAGDGHHVHVLSQTFMGSTACGSQHQHFCYSCKALYLLQQYVQREMYYHALLYEKYERKAW